MRTKEILTWLVLVYTGLVLQSTVFSTLTIFGAKPDFLLVMVVLVGILQGHQSAARKGFVIGLLEDVFVGRLIGSNALVKAIVGFLTGQVEKEIIKENVLISIFMVWVFSVIHNLLYGLLLVILGLGSTLGLDFLRTLFTFAFFNAFLALILFPFLYYLLIKGPLRVKSKP